ncbi:MAG TPA: hypothetical protein VN256_01935 [Pyrinomonadaceae bacterium]|nr:hypothetical protein [Pyrinomonadaceae bacterium]
MTEAGAAICLHLQPFLRKLAEQGSTVTRVDGAAWSNCALNVVLDKGPTLARAKKSFDLPAGLKLWHNTDTHYDLENGLACETCKHSLSWPRHESELAAP